MSNFIISRPSVKLLHLTAFWCLVVLNFALGFASLCMARFGPLRGTFLDFYFLSSAGMRGAVFLAHMASLLGLGLIWLSFPRLRHQHRWLCLTAFILGFVLAALPE